MFDDFLLYNLTNYLFPIIACFIHLLCLPLKIMYNIFKFFSISLFLTMYFFPIVILYWSVWHQYIYWWKTCHFIAHFLLYTQWNLFGILSNQTEIRLYLPCTDCFGTKRTVSELFQNNRFVVSSGWYKHAGNWVSVSVLLERILILFIIFCLLY